MLTFGRWASLYIYGPKSVYGVDFHEPSPSLTIPWWGYPPQGPSSLSLFLFLVRPLASESRAGCDNCCRAYILFLSLGKDAIRHHHHHLVNALKDEQVLPPMLHSTSISHRSNRSKSGWVWARGGNAGGQTERLSRLTCTSLRGKTGEISSTQSFSSLSCSCDLSISRCAEASSSRPFHRACTPVKYREPRAASHARHPTLSHCA